MQQINSPNKPRNEGYVPKEPVGKELKKLPTFQELINESEEDLKNNKLMVLLNQPPPTQWIKKNNGIEYLPIDKVEYLLSKIYGGYQCDIKDFKVVGNSVCVCVTVKVTNPITGKIESHDGVGAAPMQVNSGSSPTDFSQLKHNSVQLALPSAESFAIKDAAEKFGKIFGRDITRKDVLDYTSMLKEEITQEVLSKLMVEKEHNLSKEEYDRFTEIINTNETTSFKKVYNKLKSI